MALEEADTTKAPRLQLREKLTEVLTDGKPGVWYHIREYDTMNTAGNTASTTNGQERWEGLEIRSAGKVVYARVPE
jgi:hypothetical protein